MFWKDIIGDDVGVFVKKAFDKGFIASTSKIISMVLIIPKMDNPRNFDSMVLVNQLRLIYAE
jgi:hypothetical protein